MRTTPKHIINKRASRIKFIMLSLLSFLALNTFSQGNPYNLPYYDTRLIHFGFILGYNQAWENVSLHNPQPHKDTILDVNTPHQSGFTIGVVSDLKLLSFLRLRLTPSISFCNRKTIFNTSFKNSESTVKSDIETIWLEAPLELKIQAKRWQNFRPYLIGGVKYAYDLASLKRKKTDNLNIPIKLDSHEMFYTLGFGFDFYLQYFKFGIELKTSFALNDVLVHSYNTIYTSVIDKFRSQVFYINLTFE